MRSVAPRGCAQNPTCVVLTPGHFNSAYYEHSFLADSMGIELVEAADLVVDDDMVYMRTIAGRVKVDVIYRRVDDDFLDPLVFRPDSLLGVPGLIAAYAAGNVAIINAPGNGIADDKAIYSYMPEIVRFYSGAEAKLPNVETWRCREPEALRYTLDHLDELVVKLVDGSGGYGMLVGPTASKEEIATFRAVLEKEPHRYIAQPTLALSTVPTLVDQGVAPRLGMDRQAVVVQPRPFGAGLRRALRLLALRGARALPGGVVLAQGRALVGGQGTHHIAIQNLSGGVRLLVALHGAGVGLIHRAAGAAGSAGLRLCMGGSQQGACSGQGAQAGGMGSQASGHAVDFTMRVPRGAAYFRLMVVFTPWLVVLSSNQRAVTVLVWV
jgi:hypothetical protein